MSGKILKTNTVKKKNKFKFKKIKVVIITELVKAMDTIFQENFNKRCQYSDLLKNLKDIKTAYSKLIKIEKIKNIIFRN